MALRSLAFRDVARFKLDGFRGLEEVVCVGEHEFELSPEPILRREEFGPVFRGDMALSNHMVAVVRMFSSRKSHEPEWKMPVVRKGRFVSGIGTM